MVPACAVIIADAVILGRCVLLWRLDFCWAGAGVTRNKLILIIFMLGFAACDGPRPNPNAARVNAIATEFVDGYYTQFPEEVYEVGYPDAPLDRFGDHSLERLAAWGDQVDGWAAALEKIDLDSLTGTPSAITYAFARDRLQALIDRRVCRMELWNVSPTWTGWQSLIIATLAVQPVETQEQRDAAIRRAADIPRFLGTEVSNLRRGQIQGYLAPSGNVAAVIEQISTLIDTEIGDSPFSSPAARADDKFFTTQYRAIIESQVIPALIAYRDYLANDYVGRDIVGVGVNPDGDACYVASVSYWSSLAMSPEDIHRAGLSEMARIQSEMLEIARESFGTDDLKALLDQLRTQTQYTFASEQTLLDYVSSAVGRAEIAVHDWFGNVPDAKLVILPSPAYKKSSGSGFYSAGLADGSRPGTYEVGTYDPQGISQAGQEATAFHESWPGHHLQISIALFNDALHPIQRYMHISGMSEGWALYAERLADEMGIYSDDVARIGMLSNEAYRAARLVVDPGMHVMGWTRQQAIDYMLENTAESLSAISGQVDRYAAVPGQATSYLLGSLEIQRLRRVAEEALGESFDIREFHDRVLADGSVTLPMLRRKITAWIATTPSR